jgi:hypothetical protein
LDRRGHAISTSHASDGKAPHPARVSVTSDASAAGRAGGAY